MVGIDPCRDRSWQHPWLRLSLLLRAMLATRWDAEAWRQVRGHIPDVVAERARVRATGWFN
jgi:hypothetical protein